MWLWCNSTFGVLWLIFPIMLLVCLVTMFLCKRIFFAGRFECCSSRGSGWKGTGEDSKPASSAGAKKDRSPKEEG